MFSFEDSMTLHVHTYANVIFKYQFYGRASRRVTQKTKVIMQHVTVQIPTKENAQKLLSTEPWAFSAAVAKSE